MIALCVTCVCNRIFHELNGGNFKQFSARRKRENELFNEEVEEQFYKKKNRNDDEDDINGVMMTVRSKYVRTKGKKGSWSENISRQVMIYDIRLFII